MFYDLLLISPYEGEKYYLLPSKGRIKVGSYKSE
jgi:hypothetical protein